MTITQAPPTVLEESATKVLFPEARKRRRQRWTAGFLVLMVLAGGALAFGLGGGASGTSSSSAMQPPGGGNYQAFETPSRQTTSALLDYFFPTSGESLAAGFSFWNAFGAVESKAVSRCVMSKGFPAPEAQPPFPYSGDNVEFPYLSYLGAHGFSGAAGATVRSYDPTQGMTHPQVDAYKAADRSCQVSTSAVFDRAIRTGLALQANWMTIVTGIDAGGVFRHALEGWRTCTQNAGINVSNIEAFFSYADAQAHQQSGPSDFQLAGIYARCLGPAEAVRDHLRQVARTAFLSAHETAITQTIVGIDRLLTSTAAHSGNGERVS